MLRRSTRRVDPGVPDPGGRNPLRLDPVGVATLKRRKSTAQRWRDLAACLDHDTDLFFPLNERAPETAADRAAKAVCRACPVRSECLSWALEHRPQHGIFGGFSARERQRLTRRGTELRLAT